MTLFSVIIPTCDRKEMLAKCLDCLRPGIQTIGSDKYEIIVTDDGNSVQTMIELEYPWVKWVNGPKDGPAANRNNGAKYAESDWLVFTDDDCLPDAGWLYEYSVAVKYYCDVNVFEGSILPDSWDLLKKDMSECPVNDKGGAFWSANIMIKKLLFEQLNGFDEQFKIAAQEDQDLHYRLIKSEQKIIFVKEASIIHPVRIASVFKKILLIPVAIENWYKFETKRSKPLKALSKGMKSQVFGLIMAIKTIKPKKLLYHAVALTIFIPVFIFRKSSLRSIQSSSE